MCIVCARIVANVISLLFTLRTREMFFLFTLSTAILLAIASWLFILSYIDLTLFSAYSNWPAYITPFYPLFLTLFGTIPEDCFEEVSKRKKCSDTDNISAGTIP